MVKSFNTQPSICNSDYPEALGSENQFASFYSICCWCAPWWEAILLCSLPGYKTNNMLISLMQQEQPLECIWTEQQEDISKQVLIYQSPDTTHYREKSPSLLNNVKSSVLGGRVGRFQRQFAMFHFRKLIKEQLRLWLGRPWGGVCKWRHILQLNFPCCHITASVGSHSPVHPCCFPSEAAQEGCSLLPGRKEKWKEKIKRTFVSLILHWHVRTHWCHRWVKPLKWERNSFLSLFGSCVWNKTFYCGLFIMRDWDEVWPGWFQNWSPIPGLGV